MKKQNYELKNDKIQAAFQKLKSQGCLKQRLNLSWSNWGFGLEPLAVSVKRLADNDIHFIELHGNHYGHDLGYKPSETRMILDDHGVACAGICGMFSRENDLSSNSGVTRQNALDYLKRTIDFAAGIKAGYVLIVPGAVGRPCKYDDVEFERSVETIRLVADEFSSRKIKAAVEPIRSSEVSIVHTISDAIKYIEAIDHPGIQHINGDVYHMQSEEAHIAEAIVKAGKRLINLHMADTNRCALGDGSMDLDTIIKALYIIGFNANGRFVTPEPLGPGGDPYPAMYGKPDKKGLNTMVQQTVSYFREREDVLLANEQ
ncbi:MAG: sugar phosphate isomerase/epimerase [Lentisphaerota bacterium]